MKKQRFIGPVVSSKFSNSRQPDPPGISSPFVLTVLSGHSFSLPIFNGILNIADRFPEINFLIFAKFNSDNIPKNTRVLGFSDDISPYMAAAELIIAQAGHSTAMEILTLGKPALIIPIKGQIEQEYNAERMKELGMCETLDYESFNGEGLYEKIHLLLNEKKFKEKALQYSERTGQMNGSQKLQISFLSYQIGYNAIEVGTINFLVISNLWTYYTNIFKSDLNPYPKDKKIKS